MTIGIIGGSGLYRLDGAEKSETISVDTPYGPPSGEFLQATFALDGISGVNKVLFLPRHGVGHTLSPSEINYRANIFAFKKLGATTLISISAVGSLKEQIKPGDFVLPTQYIDLTRGIRPHTFFNGGVVGHAHFADPACATLREHVRKAAKELDMKIHEGGTYVCIEGPQFSTRAESQLYRSWKLDVIGMTALPEAKLAREAGLCYQTIAMATDYDCWKEEEGDVSVEAILRVLQQNVSISNKVISHLIARPFPPCRSACAETMKNAIVTAKEKWSPLKFKELEVILNPNE